MPDAYERTVREIFPDDHPGSFVPIPTPDGRGSGGSGPRSTPSSGTSTTPTPRCSGRWRGRCCSSPTRASTCCGWTRWRSSGSSSGRRASRCRRRTCCCRRSTPSAASPRRRCCSSPRRSCTRTRSSSTSRSTSASCPTTRCRWRSSGTRSPPGTGGCCNRRSSAGTRMPPGTAWVNYVRSHDDIGWTFADEDAAELGINGYEHRRFLNAFFVNRFPGSFARGVPFQDNPRTGDCRISGTTASLAGLEAGDAGGVDRILLAHSIVLSHRRRPAAVPRRRGRAAQRLRVRRRAGPRRRTAAGCTARADPADAYARRDDPSTDAGRIHSRLRHLLDVRRRTPELAGNTLIAFDAQEPAPGRLPAARHGRRTRATSSSSSPTWPTTPSTWTRHAVRAAVRRAGPAGGGRRRPLRRAHGAGARRGLAARGAGRRRPLTPAAGQAVRRQLGPDDLAALAQRLGAPGQREHADDVHAAAVLAGRVLRLRVGRAGRPRRRPPPAGSPPCARAAAGTALSPCVMALVTSSLTTSCAASSTRPSSQRVRAPDAGTGAPPARSAGRAGRSRTARAAPRSRTARRAGRRGSPARRP